MFETKETVKGYCIIVWYKTGESAPIPLMVGGKLVVCDHLVVAQDVLYRLGEGRLCLESSDDKMFYMPILAGKISRAEIYRPYDPYNVPTNFFPGVRSEVHNDPKHTLWRYHVTSWDAFYNGGQLQKANNDHFVNLATGDVLKIEQQTGVTIVPGVADKR